MRQEQQVPQEVRAPQVQRERLDLQEVPVPMVQLALQDHRATPLNGLQEAAPHRVLSVMTATSISIRMMV